MTKKYEGVWFVGKRHSEGPYYSLEEAVRAMSEKVGKNLTPEKSGNWSVFSEDCEVVSGNAWCSVSDGIALDDNVVVNAVVEKLEMEKTGDKNDNRNEV